jgi:hypothetical protein
MRYSAIVLTLAVCAIVVRPAAAQVNTGRIDVTATDLTGAALSDTAIDVSGPQDQSATTDARGEAHFLNLAPGTYAVRAKHAGFSDYLNRGVLVETGRTVPLGISLTVQGVATQVQVSVDFPVVDTKKVTTSTNLTTDDLQDVPSARDPWVLLQSVPGVVVDRLDVGGAAAGQQSNYFAKGAQFSDNTWSLDGVAITDMAATGSTPTYYDFDMFQEMEIVTGGADVRSSTPGIQMNMVLKSGTNAYRGSGRVYFENESLQANNMPPDLASTIGGTTGKGNRTHQYNDYGAEVGGPLVKDRAWFWGSAGKTHVDQLTLNGGHDRTEFNNEAVKATARLSRGFRANALYYRDDKDKFGRNAAPNRSQEATQDQTGPTQIYKGQIDFAGRAMYFSAKAAHVSGGFSLVPEGGTAASVWEDDGGIVHGSTDLYTTHRPQNTAALDGNYFRGRHELKFGLAWRHTEVRSTDSFPGTGIVTYHIGYPEMLGQVTRDNAVLTEGSYGGAYVSDTWTRDRLTVTAGLRWDRQASSLGPASAPASRALPSLLPAVTATRVDDAIVWNSVTPRIGATWALDKARKTVARATYSMFPSQLSAAQAQFISTIQAASITFLAVDLNGNKIADPSELLTGLGNQGFSGFDPLNPRRLTTLNTIGAYRTPLTHEGIFGVDRELFSHFGVTGAVTYRRVMHLDWAPFTGVTSADYVRTGTLTGDADPIGVFSVPLFALPGSKAPAGAGRTYEERPDYHQRYLGFELSAVKRLSDHWMARFGFSTNDDREYFDGNAGIGDPTPNPASANTSGGSVVTPSTGSGQSNVFLVLPRYQLVANGMYQARWGINLGFNMLVRQGYAMPYFMSAVQTGDAINPLKAVLVATDPARFRLPAVKSLDVRVEKTLTVRGANVALDLDAFNVTNRNTPLGRQYDLRLTGPTGFNQILEIMNPLIFRLGARVTF